MKAIILTLTLTFSIIVVFSQATPTLVTSPQPQMNLSTMLNHTQQHINETRLIGSICTYQFTIKTSCNSPTYKVDGINISIGDANGNEVVAQLEGLGNMETCKGFINTEVLGHCIDKICKMFISGVGLEGWMPEVIAVGIVHGNNLPIAFNFNNFISYGERFGIDYCHNNA